MNNIQSAKLRKVMATPLLCLSLLLTACTQTTDPEQEPTQDAILFGVEGVAQTKVDYDGQSADFTAGDQIGVYAFYNNFYYYYTQYSSFAESVIFANQGLIVDESKNANYSPLVSWTFSTLYGTAPHTLDVVAYYPFKEGYNEDYALLVHDDSGAATLKYYYVNSSGVVNSGVDFMTAQTRYDDSDAPEDFRSDMLALERIPLSFTRQLASLNLKVTKPYGYSDKIVVNGVTVTFDAYKEFSQTVGASPQSTWSEMTENYALTGSTECNVTLSETVYEDAPDESTTSTATYLLEDDNMFFFPPETNILKVDFDITVGTEKTTYTWHPHIATIQANTHYTLNLELDPARAN